MTRIPWLVIRAIQDRMVVDSSSEYRVTRKGITGFDKDHAGFEADQRLRIPNPARVFGNTHGAHSAARFLAKLDTAALDEL